jgi:hypothetical protein
MRRGVDRSVPRPPMSWPCCRTPAGARSPWSPCLRRCRSTRWSRPLTSWRTGSASPLGPVIVNAAYPPVPGLEVPAAETVEASGATIDAMDVAALERARVFRQRRHELQEEQVRRLAEELPLPQLRVPYLFTDAIGPLELDTLSRALAAGISALHDPAEVAR